MICPHCKKQIEDRWLYPVGTKLFRRGLYRSFHNVEVLEHVLSVEGYPCYSVKDLYQSNCDDGNAKPIIYIASQHELSLCEIVKEEMAVVPKGWITLS